MKRALYILLFVPFFSLFSQEYDLKFEEIGLEQGLSQSSVYAIAQDDKGYLWFATLDGLNKYDGYNFDVYRHDSKDTNSLSDNIVISLLNDSQGNLWVGTYSGGLCRYNKQKDNFDCFFADNNYGDISNNTIRVIFQDSKGNIFIGTDKGLNLFNGTDDTFIKAKIYKKSSESPRNIKVRAIEEFDENILVLGTDESIFLYNKNDYTYKVIPFPGDAKHRVNQLLKDNSGKIWIATSEGMYYYDMTNMSIHGFIEEFIEKDIKSLLLFNTTLWIGTRAEGIWRYDMKTSVVKNFVADEFNPGTLCDNKILSMYKDRQGLLWIGTNGSGICKGSYKQEKFITYAPVYNSKNSLNDRVVWTIHEDKDEILWVGTESGGLNKIDRNRNLYTHFTSSKDSSPVLPCNDIRCIHEEENVLWLGTGSCGVVKFQKSGAILAHYNYSPSNKKGISDNNIRFIEKDINNNLWIGTDNGLNVLNLTTGKFKKYFYNPENPGSISDNMAWSFCMDHKGDIWVGTCGGGLNKYIKTKDEFISYQTSKDEGSISNNLIRYIHEASDKTLWIATSEGLNKFNREHETFSAYTVKDGLPNNLIYAILEDKKGSLWLSTNKGISKFNPKTIQFVNYDVKDGLQSNEFNQGAAFKSRSGQMFFGGINGFNAFFPSEIIEEKYTLPVVITDFFIFNQPANIGNEEPIKKHISYAKSITLSYFQNMFSFEFSAMNYENPLKNKYAYKMKGFDKDWIEAGNRNFATYTNLNPGKYVFKVKNVTNYKIGREPITQVNLHIKPPFWRTVYFYVILALVVIIAVFFYIRLRIYRLRKSQVQLENNVKERTEEINKQKEEIRQQLRYLESVNKELERLSVVARETDNAVIITNDKAELEWVNEGFERMHGYSLQEFKAKVGKTLFEASGNKDIIKNINDCIRTKQSVVYLSENITKTGDKIFTQTTLTPIIDKNGKLKKIIAIDSDYTKLKKAQQEIKNVKEAGAVSKAKSEFLATMSHEIRTPLNAVIGFVKLLEKEPQSEKGQQYIKTILSNTNILLSLITDILDLSKMEMDSLKINQQPVELKRIMEDIVNIFKIKASEKRIDLKLHFDKELPAILFLDEIRIRQLMLNLVGNALKFTDKGFVAITTWCQNHQQKDKIKLFIEVEDTGVGIPEKEQEHIFEAFQQADSKSIRKFSGTGIGLTIASKLVKAMGGEIDVKSKVGKGSVFNVVIPGILVASEKLAEMSEEQMAINIANKEDDFDQTVLQKFKKKIEKEKVDKETLVNLPEILKIIDSEYLREFYQIKRTPRINFIKEFASGIKILGKNYKVEILVDFGQMLLNEASNFNIGRMKKIIEYFPGIIENIRELGGDSHENNEK